MRSTPFALSLMAMLATLASPALAEGTEDYVGQEDPLTGGGTISGRALTHDTEVLTPKGILNEEAFNALNNPAQAVLQSGGEGYGFDDEGSTFAPIEPAAGDTQRPYATVTGKPPYQEGPPAQPAPSPQPAAIPSEPVQDALNPTFQPDAAPPVNNPPATQPAAPANNPEVTGVTLPAQPVAQTPTQPTPTQVY